MPNEFFLLVLTLGIALFFAWAFRVLPKERWQIIAAVPVGKDEDGGWQGLNLTYYGFFMATSNVFGILLLLILLASINVSAGQTFVLSLVVFAVCWPAAGIIARIVEKKAYTFTIGGASFAGAILMPWLIQLMNWYQREHGGRLMPVIPTFAAVSIAYAYGEGVGRLACISFGCCYGKRVDQLSPFFRRLLSGLSFTFTGATKKVSYEGGLEGVQVVPIQAITAVVLTIIGLLGTLLFLRHEFGAALIFTVTATQVWRFLSELFRADVRGNAEKISAYQVMALLMVVYTIAIVFLLPMPNVPVSIDLRAGIESVWNPLALVLFQLAWLAIFLHTGRSKVTGSTLSFHVHRDRI